MSDDDYDSYDDDDFFWVDEGPVAEADELAAQVIQSPVYEVPLEVVEGYSDWEEYPDWDEYYDRLSPVPGQIPIGGEGQLGSRVKRKAAGQISKARKKRKLVSTEKIPELSLGEEVEGSEEPRSSASIVVWKTEATFKSKPLPLVGDGEGHEVALLKDWRERFKPPYKYPVSTAKVDGDRGSNLVSKDISTATDGTTKRSTQEKSKVANNSTRSRKRPAESDQTTMQPPRKRASTSRTTPPIKLPISSSTTPILPSRKRKAASPPEPYEAALDTTHKPASQPNLPPRNLVSVNPSSPLRKSASRLRKVQALVPSDAPEKVLAERGENSTPVKVADQGGMVTRRSKRLKGD